MIPEKSERHMGSTVFGIAVAIVLILVFTEIAPSLLIHNVDRISVPQNYPNSHKTLAEIPVTLYNNQTTGTLYMFNQQVIVNSSTFSAYEAQNLQNVIWSTQNGTVIPSWIESGDSNSSTSTIYWLRIPFSIPSNSSATIYLGFIKQSSNLFSQNGNEGLYPSATPTYGQYDNGAFVFAHYWNFQGQTTPSGLAVIQSGGATVTFNNGVTLYDPVGYFHSGFITTSDYSSSLVWMVNVSSYKILSGGPGVFPLSISDTSYFSPQDNYEGFAGGFPHSVYGNSQGANYYTTGLTHGNILHWNETIGNVSTYSMSWENKEVTGYSKTMEKMGNSSFSNFIEDSYTYFSSYIETGGLGSAQITENWVAAIMLPPSGVMPSYSIILNPSGN